MINQDVSSLVLGKVQEASAINNMVQTFISVKANGQDLVLGDSETLGFLLILEQLEGRLSEAINDLENLEGEKVA